MCASAFVRSMVSVYAGDAFSFIRDSLFLFVLFISKNICFYIPSTVGIFSLFIVLYSCLMSFVFFSLYVLIFS